MRKLSAIIFGLLIGGSTTYAQNLPSLGWQCEAQGFVVYDSTPSCSYYCGSWSRQIGESFGSLVDGQQGATNKVLREAQQAGWKDIRNLSPMHCWHVAGIDYAGTKTQVSVEGWSQKYEFLFGLQASIRADKVCQMDGKRFARQFGSTSRREDPSGNVFQVSVYTCEN